MVSQTRLGSVVRRWRAVDLPDPPAAPEFTFAETSHKFPPDAANYWRAQWYAGQSGKGRIGDYAPSTIRRKKRKGLPYDRVVLYETGLLYSQTAIKRLARDIMVKVEVPYASYLAQRYGDRIWDLGGQQRAGFLEAYKQAIIRAYKRTLGNGRG